MTAGSESFAKTVEKVKKRAQNLGLGLRPASDWPWGWDLDNGHRVVKNGALDQIDAYLAEREA